MEYTNEQEKKFRSGESGPKYMFRGPRFEWGILVLKPGETLGAHFHEQVEETFYLEEGEAVMVINGKETPAKKGDAFRLDPKDTHDILNRASVPCRFIFIKTPWLPDDKKSC
jgi:mannose-6-phosphate isomerase-like protein (cupin superfamily)